MSIPLTPIPPADVIRLRDLFQSFADGRCVACGSERATYQLLSHRILVGCADCDSRTQIELTGEGERNPAPRGSTEIYEPNFADLSAPLVLISHHITWPGQEVIGGIGSD